MARVSEDFIKKTLSCKTLEELEALAKAEGVTLSPEEAKQFLADANSVVTEDLLDKVAGEMAGGYYTYGSAYVTNC